MPPPMSNTISRSDIDWMFANYIDRVIKVDFVRDYVKRQDFDELNDAIRKVERALARAK